VGGVVGQHVIRLPTRFRDVRQHRRPHESATAHFNENARRRLRRDTYLGRGVLPGGMNSFADFDWSRSCCCSSCSPVVGFRPWSEVSASCRRPSCKITRVKRIVGITGTRCCNGRREENTIFCTKRGESEQRAQVSTARLQVTADKKKNSARVARPFVSPRFVCKLLRRRFPRNADLEMTGKSRARMIARTRVSVTTTTVHNYNFLYTVVTSAITSVGRVRPFGENVSVDFWSGCRCFVVWLRSSGGGGLFFPFILEASPVVFVPRDDSSKKTFTTSYLQLLCAFCCCTRNFSVYIMPMV